MTLAPRKHPWPDQAGLGRGERHNDLVVLVQEARAAFAVQHADHVIRLPVDPHALPDDAHRVPEQVRGDRTAQHHHR